MVSRNGSIRHVLVWVLTVLFVGGLVFLLREDRPDPTISPESRGRLALRLGEAVRTASARGPALETTDVARLWAMVDDDHDLVRGMALEALWKARLETTISPARLEKLKRCARTDTDFDRRGACCLLLRHDPAVAIPLAAQLWDETENPNTRRALAEAAASLSADSRSKLEAEAGSATDSPRRRFARGVVRADGTDRFGTPATRGGTSGSSRTATATDGALRSKGR